MLCDVERLEALLAHAFASGPDAEVAGAIGAVAPLVVELVVRLEGAPPASAEACLSARGKALLFTADAMLEAWLGALLAQRTALLAQHVGTAH